MPSDRIKYGIDLGTTNSVMAELEQGKTRVVKTKDTFQSETTPSAVAFIKRRIGESRVVGNKARIELNRNRERNLISDSSIINACVEFKRTMGTDLQYAPAVDSALTLSSEDLSCEVLKELKSHVSDGKILAAVVSIPAAFKVPQQQATLRAAELAGIRQCILLQEPSAAAMAFKNNLVTGTQDSMPQKWLVFDFGGGTFDSALVLVEEGEVDVKDTEGDNFLGGKDLDYAIVNEIFIDEVIRDANVRAFWNSSPDRKRRLLDVLKKFAELARIALSSTGRHEVYTELDAAIKLPDGYRPIELDFEITRDQLRPVLTPFFQRAIDKACVLLERNGLTGSDLDELILVGGPTYSPILRQMLTDQIRKPNTSVDPMTIVAQGAALFGGTIPLQQNAFPESQSGGELALDVGYESTTNSAFEFVSVKLSSDSDCSHGDTFEVELVASNSMVGWRTGKQQLTGQGALFELKLEENKPNVFDIVVTTEHGDSAQAFPTEITIIHGTKIAGSPLTNNLGVEVYEGDRRVFKALKGAEKSKTLPVTGAVDKLLVPNQITPGVESDSLLIRIYEGGADAEGKPVCLSDHVQSLELRGTHKDVVRVIPAGTALKLTVTTQETCSAPEDVRIQFPALDDKEYKLEIPTKKLSLQTDWINDEANEAQNNLQVLVAGGHVPEEELKGIRKRLKEVLCEFRKAPSNSDDKFQAIDRLREVLRDIYGLVEQNEWQIAEVALDEAWADLKRANREEGKSEARLEMREAKRNLDQVKESRDIENARVLKLTFEHERFKLKRCEWSKAAIAWARQEFTSIRWKNVHEARHVVQRGVRALMDDRPCSELLRHAGQILRLVVRDSTGDSRLPIPLVGGFLE